MEKMPQSKIEPNRCNDHLSKKINHPLVQQRREGAVHEKFPKSRKLERDSDRITSSVNESKTDENPGTSQLFRALREG